MSSHSHPLPRHTALISMAETSAAFEQIQRPWGMFGSMKRGVKVKKASAADMAFSNSINALLILRCW